MTTTLAASSYDLSSPMVSHPQGPDRAFTMRGPPSTSSRTTNTRRHRNNRSHHGGTSYMPQNEFPNFAHTGDVEIVINADGQEKRYLLHRLILAQCSGFFEAGTSEEWSRAQAQNQGQSPTQASESGLSRIGEEDDGSQVESPSFTPRLLRRPFWRYELDGGSHDDEVPMLVQKVNRTASHSCKLYTDP